MTGNTCFTRVLGGTNFDLQESNEREDTALVPLTPRSPPDTALVLGRMLLVLRRCYPWAAWRAGCLYPGPQPLTQKKKKQEWYRVTGREVYGRALGVITTQPRTTVS